MFSSSILQPNGIQAILFDLDNTLRFSRPASTEAFLDFAVKMGAADSPEKRRRAIRWTHSYWAQSPELLEDKRAFNGQGDPFWVNYALRHLVAFDCSPEWSQELAPEIHRYMKEEHRPAEWVPPEIPTTLRRLKEAGFRLGVLSNRDNPCQETLAQLGLLPYFDLALVAGELACWKPDPAIFHHAIQRLDLLPEQAVYVGDNYYADIVGARQAGLHPVLLDPEGIFPDADCPVIQSMDELPFVLTAH
ncbi:MAG TPA: HAD family hydrolase [Anaerolineales bacterium]